MLILSPYRRFHYEWDRYDASAVVIMIGVLGFILGSLAAWCTHIGWIVLKLAGDSGVTFGQVILAVLGTVVPPIGVVHGVLIWFGFH